MSARVPRVLVLFGVVCNLVGVAPAFSEPVIGASFALVGCLPLPLAFAPVRLRAFRAFAVAAAVLYITLVVVLVLVGGAAYAPGALMFLAAALIARDGESRWRFSLAVLLVGLAIVVLGTWI